ncbi:hypothetical protein Hanom_Chr14g01319571 [Helianthus anomalus]
MLYDRAGLDETVGAYTLLFNQLSPFQFALYFLFLIYYFSFFSRFPSYIEGNVKFKCGDGNYRLVSS